eukprot:1085530-Prorocentrum_minimum.AAC.2
MQPLGGAQGQAADIEIQGVLRITCGIHSARRYDDVLERKVGGAWSLEKIIEDTDRDFFMSADDALAYGLVDHVIQTPQLAKLRELEMYPKYDLSM